MSTRRRGRGTDGQPLLGNGNGGGGGGGISTTGYVIAIFLLAAAVLGLAIGLTLGLGQPKWKYTADYVIVGFGSAGSVIAHDLTEDPNVRVIALSKDEDAGRSENPVMKELNYDNFFFLESTPPWSKLETTTQDITGEFDPNFLAFLDGYLQTVDFTTYAGMGGSVQHNYALVRRYSKKFWDYFSSTYGGSAWEWANVLQAYKELETYDGESENPSLRGTTGPLNTTLSLPHVNELFLNPDEVGYLFIEAFKMVQSANGNDTTLDRYTDYAATPDDGTGISGFQFSGRRTAPFPGGDAADPINLERTTPFYDMLGPDVLDRTTGLGKNGRENLRVLFPATGTKILFDQYKNAIGVRVSTPTETYNVRALKGVISSAGWAGSPILLQRSGIWDQEKLAELNIPLVHHNPEVGENLRDTMNVDLFVSTNNSAGFDELAELAPLINTNLKNSLYKNFTNFQISVGDGFGAFSWTLDLDTVFESRLPPDDSLFYFNLDFQPEKGGVVRITSNSFDVNPIVISPRFLNTDPETGDGPDILHVRNMTVVLRQVLEKVEELNPAFKFTWISPGQAEWDDFDSGNSQALDYAIYAHTLPFNTMYGTCAMGTVVDDRLKVTGVNRLWVADTSIMTEVQAMAFSATNSLMIGRIASKIIRNIL